MNASHPPNPSHPLLQTLGAVPEDFFRVAGALQDEEAEGFADAGGVLVAPSITRGIEKYSGMLKRDSPTVAWRIALKTDRRARTVYEDRLPAGFPMLHDFFSKAKSLRVFEVGLETYRSLYENPSYWAQWHSDVENIAQWHVQTLRNAIITKFSPSLNGVNGGQKPSRVQLSILRRTVEIGIWHVKFKAHLPKRLRLEVRWGLVRWALRVRRYGLAWADHHAERQAERQAEHAKHAERKKPWVVNTPVENMSPSLKRQRL